MASYWFFLCKFCAVFLILLTCSSATAPFPTPVSDDVFESQALGGRHLLQAKQKSFMTLFVGYLFLPSFLDALSYFGMWMLQICFWYGDFAWRCWKYCGNRSLVDGSLLDAQVVIVTQILA
ncbi:Protein kinase domain-containing protein [Psidium guajava]|nr:Protein kinase domain-containing protein [Psidium guajava]